MEPIELLAYMFWLLGIYLILQRFIKVAKGEGTMKDKSLIVEMKEYVKIRSKVINKECDRLLLCNSTTNENKREGCMLVGRIDAHIDLVNGLTHLRNAKLEGENAILKSALENSILGIKKKLLSMPRSGMKVLEGEMTEDDEKYFELLGREQETILMLEKLEKMMKGEC